MSFQGDVAGIGLGELLQGLARGGRDGVLTLDGKTLSSALGLKGGRLFLLEGPDEDDETWRLRAHEAWAEAPSAALETVRRETIARAHRMEVLYRMLEAPNLSFRFEPGPLPMPSNYTRTAAAEDVGSISLDAGIEEEPQENPWGPGVTVEFLLLEHARIADEASLGPGATLSGTDVPRSLDPSRHAPEVRDFLEQCDGNSTLQEISDRLGWPLTQCRCTIGDHLNVGNLRIAEARELLACAQRELKNGRISRAATRVTGWIRSTPPGIPPIGDAQLLVSEWDSGSLNHVLSSIRPADGRALLRMLDHVQDNPGAQRERWRALHEAHRADEITLLHSLALRLVATEEPEARTYHDLLRLARAMQERGFQKRSRTLLRLAASNLPPRPQTRIELGKRMLENGLVVEGSSWLLNTARELIATGDGERAHLAVSEVLKKDPDSAEAAGLLIESRSLLAKRQRRRWNTLVGLSVGLVVSLGALVRFRAHQESERMLDEVAAISHQPQAALDLLDTHFGNDSSSSVDAMRARLSNLLRETQREKKNEWSQHYSEVEDECRYGDPVLGLKRALELPQAPDEDDVWAKRQELLVFLGKRLDERGRELDLPVSASRDDLRKEEMLLVLLNDLVFQLGPAPEAEQASAFRFRLVELRDKLAGRRDERATVRQAKMVKDKEKEQDILLAAARSHEQAGDLERALLNYERLLETDTALGDIPTLQQEIDRVRQHWEALQEATRLATEGKHDEAVATLEGVCTRLIEHTLPWRVESRPPGARVKLPYGQVRKTPFVAQSAIGEHFVLELEFDGHGSRKVVVTRPRNVVVHLHREAERTWASEHLIEAAPVAVGDDHVVADRFGRIRRVNRNNEPRWERSLSTLGGVARTPVFLPGKPGYLLVLSEDGAAWLLNSATGEVMGPRDIGAPPKDGPRLTRGGITASFTDGRVAVWTDGLEPTFYGADSLVQETPGGTNKGTDGHATLAVLQRSAHLETSLDSPWSDWKVEVHDEEFLVIDADRRGFTIERKGDWVFVAWEAPNALIPYGRLWVSDEFGLRSFLPGGDHLVRYDR